MKEPKLIGIITGSGKLVNHENLERHQCRRLLTFPPQFAMLASTSADCLEAVEQPCGIHGVLCVGLFPIATPYQVIIRDETNSIML